jgi:hypothetical protein
MSRLLILACSRRKRSDPALLPAIERYDGPAFRVVRRFLRIQPAPPPSIYILSAKFGLIGQQEPIPDYDQPMTAERAGQLGPALVDKLRQIVSANCCSELFLCLGRTYLLAMSGFQACLPPGTSARVCDKGSGIRLTHLHDWLYGSAPERSRIPAEPSPCQTATLRGQRVTGTPQELLAVASRALQEGTLEAGPCHSWYVSIDGQCVPPKRLVGRLTGLPSSTFHTDQAVSILQQLGIMVLRR